MTSAVRKRVVLQLERLAKSLLLPIVLGVLSSLAAMLWSHLQHGLFKEFSHRYLTQTKMSAYEHKIALCTVDASKIRQTLDSIGGLTHIKEDLRRDVLLPLKYPKIFYGSASALHPCKGILLHGPPGTGKTMLARAIAAEANVPFISLSLSTLENKYYGETGKLLAAAFSYARSVQPAIIFFDEIDGLLRVRSDSDQSCVYGLKTELLNNMDGLDSQKTDAVVVIGCTNNPNSLDPALKRRLPRAFRIGLPSTSEREHILQLITASEQPRVATAMLARLAEETEGMSGSDLDDCYKQASAARLSEHQQRHDFIEQLETLEDGEALQQLLKPLEYHHWSSGIQSKQGVPKVQAVARAQDDQRSDAPSGEEDEDEDVPEELPLSLSHDTFSTRTSIVT